MTPRSAARLAELRREFADDAWRRGLTPEQLAELDGAYSGITPADIDAAAPWVALAERYGEVYVYPLAEPVAGAWVQIEVVRTGEDLILTADRAGRWSALMSPRAADVYHEGEGTGAGSLVAWLASVGWVAMKPASPAPPWRVRGQPLREEGFREVEFHAPPPGLVAAETEEDFAARVERLRQWARKQLARDPAEPAGLDPSPW